MRVKTLRLQRSNAFGITPRKLGMNRAHPIIDSLDSGKRFFGRSTFVINQLCFHAPTPGVAKWRSLLIR